MKKTKILAPEEYYHVYCRGNNKEPIFFIEKDYYRLLTNLLLFQSPIPINHLGRIVDAFYQEGFDSIDKNLISEIIEGRTVELISFILMPNHFHLLLRQLSDNGVTDYMKRLLNSYTKYINIRHNRTGHIFQGRFGRVLVEDNNQLLYLSTYIHRNCRALPQWKNKEEKYPWSSYQDFVSKNRWNNLLVPNIIIDQFSSVSEFTKFTKTSAAKTKSFLSSDILHPSFPRK